jgi:hypothetical protein
MKQQQQFLYRVSCNLIFYSLLFTNAFYASLSIHRGSFFDALQVGLGMLGFLWLKENFNKSLKKLFFRNTRNGDN